MVPVFKYHKSETQDRQLIGSPINLKYNFGAFNTCLYRKNIIILSGKSRPLRRMNGTNFSTRGKSPRVD